MSKPTRPDGNSPRPCDDEWVTPDVTPDVTPLALARPARLVLRGQTFDAARPAVMAIINRTKDSFYQGNRHADLNSALAALDTAVALGADIVDIGGVRAGQEGEEVTVAMEIDRVVPFLERARAAYPDLILSLDTWRSEVARAAAHAGVDLVNDTWAGFDADLLATAVEIGAGYVISHTGGYPPRTDPVDVTYGPGELDVVADVVATLQAGAQRVVGGRRRDTTPRAADRMAGTTREPSSSSREPEPRGGGLAEGRELS